MVTALDAVVGEELQAWPLGDLGWLPAGSHRALEILGEQPASATLGFAPSLVHTLSSS